MDCDCNTCIHDGNDEVCSECSQLDDDLSGCSCHISPPCSYCVGNQYEEKPNEGK